MKPVEDETQISNPALSQEPLFSSTEHASPEAEHDLIHCHPHTCELPFALSVFLVLCS